MYAACRTQGCKGIVLGFHPTGEIEWLLILPGLNDEPGAKRQPSLNAD